MNMIASGWLGRDDADEEGLVVGGHEQWIVCAGTTRYARRGRVTCPRGGVREATECLACHLLETFADERDPRVACATIQ
jgi:hypothetical protein